MSNDFALICPLRPSISPLGDIGDDADPGWHDLESAPIRIEQPAAAKADAEAEDVIDVDDGVEAQMPRGIPSPPEPSAAEVARHNLTHFPYRSWCPHCLACRRPNAPHRQSKSSSSRKVPFSVLIIASSRIPLTRPWVQSLLVDFTRAAPRLPQCVTPRVSRMRLPFADLPNL